MQPAEWRWRVKAEDAPSVVCSELEDDVEQTRWRSSRLPPGSSSSRWTQRAESHVSEFLTLHIVQ